jgi:methionyl-tRNA synthetase
VFPGSQIGSGDKWTQVRHISATEYLSYEGGKFSKSKGVGVFGDSARETGVDADIWRFFLLSRRPESGTDTAFKWQDFIDVNNNELLKNLGNFVNRVVKFCHAKMGAVVPQYTAMEGPQAEIDSLLASYIAHFEDMRMRLALAVVLQISAVGNKFLQDNKFDNQLLAANPQLCANIVGTALNHIHLLANLLSPFMPKTAESIFEQLGVEPVAKIPDTWNANGLVHGRALGEPRPLFSRIAAGKLEEWQEKFAGDVGKQKRLEAEKAAEKAAAKKAAEKAKKEKKKMMKKAAATAEAGVAALNLK